MGVNCSAPPAGLICSQRNTVRDIGQSPGPWTPAGQRPCRGPPGSRVSPADPGQLCKGEVAMPVLETRRPRPGLAGSALTTGRTMRSEPLDALPECPAAPARLRAGLGAPNRGEIQGGPPWAQVPRTTAGGPGTAALLPRMRGLSRHGTALSPSVSGQGGRPHRNPEGARWTGSPGSAPDGKVHPYHGRLHGATDGTQTQNRRRR